MLRPVLWRPCVRAGGGRFRFREIGVSEFSSGDTPRGLLVFVEMCDERCATMQIKCDIVSHGRAWAFFAVIRIFQAIA